MPLLFHIESILCFIQLGLQPRVALLEPINASFKRVENTRDLIDHKLWLTISRSRVNVGYYFREHSGVVIIIRMDAHEVGLTLYARWGWERLSIGHLAAIDYVLFLRYLGTHDAGSEEFMRVSWLRSTS